MASSITKEGYDRLLKHISDLKKELERTIEERSKAAAEGDLKENSAYIFMSERAEVLRSQIAEAQADLKQVDVQSAPAHSDVISFGHQVKVLFVNDNRELQITLVGKNDASLKPGWISTDSPIGQALLNKKVGDKVMVNGQPVSILSVEPADI